MYEPSSRTRFRSFLFFLISRFRCSLRYASAGLSSLRPFFPMVRGFFSAGSLCDLCVVCGMTERGQE